MARRITDTAQLENRASWFGSKRFTARQSASEASWVKSSRGTSAHQP
jgi:hypothetical protein